MESVAYILILTLALGTLFLRSPSGNPLGLKSSLLLLSYHRQG